MHFDIAIIGYGPVGAVAANMFGASGHDVVVIEPKKDIWDIPRAVALDGQTQRIFQSIGIIDDIARTPFEGLKFINKKGKEIVYVDFSNNPQPNGYYETVGFSQPDLEKDLRSRAIKYENITFTFFGRSLSRKACMLRSEASASGTRNQKKLRARMTHNTRTIHTNSTHTK